MRIKYCNCTEKERQICPILIRQRYCRRTSRCFVVALLSITLTRDSFWQNLNEKWIPFMNIREWLWTFWTYFCPCWITHVNQIRHFTSHASFKQGLMQIKFEHVILLQRISFGRCEFFRSWLVREWSPTFWNYSSLVSPRSVLIYAKRRVPKRSLIFILTSYRIHSLTYAVILYKLYYLLLQRSLKCPVRPVLEMC